MPDTTPAPHQHAGYGAVWEVIRATPGDAWRNALIWRAVEAYRIAADPEQEKRVREQVARESAVLRPDDLAELLGFIVGGDDVRVVEDATITRAFAALKATLPHEEAR